MSRSNSCSCTSSRRSRSLTTRLPHIIDFNDSVTTASTFFLVVSLKNCGLAIQNHKESKVVRSTVPPEKSLPEPERPAIRGKRRRFADGLTEIDIVVFVASGARNFVVGSTTIGPFSFDENNYSIKVFVTSESDTSTAQPPRQGF